MKILIVEDEKSLADSLKTLLEEKGFTVETVYDGITGSEYAQLGIYDLLILDVMMPGLDCYRLVCGSRSIRLSVREFDVTRCLLQAGERIVSKETLLARVYRK